MNTTTSRLLLAGLCAGSLLAAGGCRGDREDRPPRQFFPDMEDQPKWRAQGESVFFADGRMMRKPPQGTVAFGRTSVVSDEPWAAAFAHTRDDLLKADHAYYTGGVEGTQDYVDQMPVTVTMDLLRRGQSRFDIYCAACHGYTGDGQGTVAPYFAVRPANLLESRFITAPEGEAGGDPVHKDGYMFHVIREGVRSMPAYGHAMSERDSWAIVAYVRALQAARTGTLADVPEGQRPAVERAIERARAEQAAAAQQGGGQ